jgi:hypothetical protein
MKRPMYYLVEESGMSKRMFVICVTKAYDVDTPVSKESSEL